jgi:hypothetical protein
MAKKSVVTLKVRQSTLLFSRGGSKPKKFGPDEHSAGFLLLAKRFFGRIGAVPVSVRTCAWHAYGAVLQIHQGSIRRMQ